MVDNDYASLYWSRMSESGSIGPADSSPPLQRADILWRNHDLCQRQEGCQIEQGKALWANNDKCPIHFLAQPPKYISLWPEMKLHSASLDSSLHPSTMVLTKIYIITSWCCHALSCHSCPFFPSLHLCCSVHLLLCIPYDLSIWRLRCLWWIPMIRSFRERGARQSPLSCDWAICLCQTSHIHPTWARQWTRGREMTKMVQGRRSDPVDEDKNEEKNGRKKHRSSHLVSLWWSFDLFL